MRPCGVSLRRRFSESLRIHHANGAKLQNSFKVSLLASAEHLARGLTAWKLEQSRIKMSVGLIYPQTFIFRGSSFTAKFLAHHILLLNSVDLKRGLCIDQLWSTPPVSQQSCA